MTLTIIDGTLRASVELAEVQVTLAQTDYVAASSQDVSFFSSETASAQEAALIFLHIPKTAGSTLHHVIRRQFRRRAVYETFSVTPSGIRIWTDELEALSVEERSRIRYLWLHGAPFGLHQHLPRPSTYVTLLRDPIDRVVSQYYYRKSKPDHLLNGAVMCKHMSLREWVSSPEATKFSNLQTRFIAGLSRTELLARPIDHSIDLLEVARKNLREHFSLVGLSDRFDESLILLRRDFGWRNILYSRRNVGKARPGADAIGAETRRLILGHNELDAELYDYAKQAFEKRVREQDCSFIKEVQRFKLLNRAYQEIINKTSPMGHPARQLVRSARAVSKRLEQEPPRALSSSR